MREAALLLSPEAPYPLHGGGQLRTASIANFLSNRYDLDLIVFREPGAADPRASLPAGLLRDVLVVELPFHYKTPAARMVRNAGRLLRGAPPLLDRFSAAHETVGRHLRGRHYEIAVIEHFWCAPYWTEIAPISGKTVLDLHNIESLLHARCGASARSPEAFSHRLFARAYRSLEAQWLPRFHVVLTPSEEDRAIAARMAPRVIVYPNAIPEQPAPHIPRDYAIAFSGNFEYHPNRSAVAFFVREIWPALRRRHPGLEWRLIGRNAHAVARHIDGDPQIRATGPVESGVAELAAVRVAVVPLLAGSGTRFKIIEAWAAATPVVSTSLGAEGLPAHLMIADTGAAFADAVSRLLTDEPWAASLASEGRAAYESQFTWPAAWQTLRSL